MLKSLLGHNCRNGTEQNNELSVHTFSFCAAALSSLPYLLWKRKQQPISFFLKKGFYYRVHFTVRSKWTWMGVKSYFQFVNLEGACVERLKAVWDSSTPYEKKTKGWQGETHAAMFSLAKKCWCLNQNEGLQRRILLCEVSLQPKIPCTILLSLQSFPCSSEMKQGA